MAARFHAGSVSRTLIIVQLCGSGWRFRWFAIYLIGKCDFIGEASAYLCWFNIPCPVDSVSHWFRISDARYFDVTVGSEAHKSPENPV